MQDAIQVEPNAESAFISKANSMSDRQLLVEIYMAQHQMRIDIMELAMSNTKLKKAVFGNGEPGLDEKVRNLEMQLSVAKKVMYAIGGVLLTLLITFFWNVLINQTTITIP